MFSFQVRFGPGLRATLSAPFRTAAGQEVECGFAVAQQGTNEKFVLIAVVLLLRFGGGGYSLPFGIVMHIIINAVPIINHVDNIEYLIIHVRRFTIAETVRQRECAPLSAVRRVRLRRIRSRERVVRRPAAGKPNHNSVAQV